jgi:hypothetical protein
MQRRSRLFAAILVVAALPLLACTQPKAPPPKSEAPAKTEALPGTDLKRMTLTSKAAQRIGVKTVPVREEQVVRWLRVGGEVVASPEGAGTAATPGKVWVRVPLTPGELTKVDRGQAMRVLPLVSGAAALTAQPFEVPGGGGTQGAAPALHYAVDGSPPGLAPGQRVVVELPRPGNGSPRKVIPYAAVIYDPGGRTWTYTSPEPLVFVRQPIAVDAIEGDVTVLSEGPPVGTAVVTDGASELFGAETGIGK